MFFTQWDPMEGVSNLIGEDCIVIPKSAAISTKKKVIGRNGKKYFTPGPADEQSMAVCAAFVKNTLPKSTGKEAFLAKYAQAVADSRGWSTEDVFNSVVGQMIAHGDLAPSSIATYASYAYKVTRPRTFAMTRTMAACEMAHAEYDAKIAPYVSEKDVRRMIVAAKDEEEEAALYCLATAPGRAADMKRLKPRQVGFTKTSFVAQFRVTKTNKKRSGRRTVYIPYKWIAKPRPAVTQWFLTQRQGAVRDTRLFPGWSCTKFNRTLKRIALQLAIPLPPVAEGEKQRYPTTYSFRYNYINKAVDMEADKEKLKDYTLHQTNDMVAAHYQRHAALESGVA